MKEKKIIFLNGGGNEKDSLELDKNFVNLLNNNSTVLYIPHANKKQYPYYENSKEWLTNALNNVDKNKAIVIYIPKSYDEFGTIDLNKYAAIYIGGGNTFFLLNLFVRYNFDEKIINYYNRGGIIYGGSAGAIIMGKNIETVIEEENDKNEISKGLNLLKGYSLVCHTDEKVLERMKNCNVKPIICLYENSGIIFKNDKFISLGKSYKEIK